MSLCVGVEAPQPSRSSGYFIGCCCFCCCLLFVVVVVFNLGMQFLLLCLPTEVNQCILVDSYIFYFFWHKLLGKKKIFFFWSHLCKIHV